MTFVAATGFGVGDRGLELINVSVSGEGDNIFLTRVRSPVSNPPQQFRDPVVLLQGKMQARFIYMDRTGKAFETWANRPNLPAAVAVQLDVPQRGPLFPRPVILPIPVNTSVDCIAISEDEGEEKPPRCDGEVEQRRPPPTSQNVPGQGTQR
jgi:hypothetical protein